MEELQKVFAHTQRHVLHSADTGHLEMLVLQIV